MSQQVILNPKVFVSYSWTTSEHEEWVVELATRLRHDGIDVILDKWDLKEGHDKYVFMESMVTSDAVDKVLIICDLGYQVRADSRLGGVGTETQIITPKIYADVNQEKFIPIIAERDEQGNHFIPTYIANRIYIDLSSSEIFEENYEKLIRNIYRVPLYKKPSLGKAPEYLFEGETQHFQTANVLRQIKANADKHPNRLKYLWNEFVVAFCESLDGLSIGETSDFDEMINQIVRKIDESIPLRNDYISVIELMCMTEMIEADQLIEFFERIYSYTEFHGSGSYFEAQFDHFKYIVNELFLYSIAILLKSKKYSLVSQVLHTDYYTEKSSRNEPKDFTDFRFYLKSLDYRNGKLHLNRLSLHADLLIQHSYGKYKNELLTADIVLYNLSKLYFTDDGWGRRVWFPTTYIYLRDAGVLKIFSRLKSRSHFETVKALFNVENEADLKSKIIEIKGDNGYSYGGGIIPLIRTYIKPDEICSTP